MAYSLAHETSIPYTVDYRFVDLFINGVFRGNYMLCEKIEVGKHRVNIYDLDKTNESKNEDFSFSADDTNSVVCSDSKKWVNYPFEPENDPSSRRFAMIPFAVILFVFVLLSAIFLCRHFFLKQKHFFSFLLDKRHKR